MDSDRDGRINLPQFCTAMSLISQAKQAAAGGGGGGGGMQRGGGLQGNSLHSSLSSSAVSQFAICILCNLHYMCMSIPVKSGINAFLINF